MSPLAGKLVPEEDLQVVTAEQQWRLGVLASGHPLERSLDVAGRLEVVLAEPGQGASQGSR
jgi:hypothetical protein